MRRAVVLSSLVLACLTAGSSPAAASSQSAGSLNYAVSTTSTTGMHDVGMVYGTVAAEMAGTQRSYTAQFPDDSAGGGFAGPPVASISLEQSTLGMGRQIFARMPSGNIVDVTPGAGVTTTPGQPPVPVTTFKTADGGWTPGRSYRLRVRQIARPSGGRRFRVSVTNVVTGGERVIVDFTRRSLAALSLRATASVSARNQSTCASLVDARASIDRPRGVRGSDGATIVAGAAPSFHTDPYHVCPASQRRISTDRIVIDLGR